MTGIHVLKIIFQLHTTNIKCGSKENVKVMNNYLKQDVHSHNHTFTLSVTSLFLAAEYQV